MYDANQSQSVKKNEEIVYSRNFEDIQIRASVFDLYQTYVMIVGQKSHIEYSLLENEDKDAWKQYLKRGLIKKALENCQSRDRPTVAGLYADQLF